MKIKTYSIIALSTVVFLLCSFTFFQNKPWAVPEKYTKMKNPVKSDDAESLKNGKDLWNKHCSSCHGKTGKGDGSKAAQLETPLSDFTTDEVQKQSDGELFYKTLEGRDEMPTFKKKIPEEEDVWLVINYVRSMKK